MFEITLQEIRQISAEDMESVLRFLESDTYQGLQALCNCIILDTPVGSRDALPRGYFSSLLADDPRTLVLNEMETFLQIHGLLVDITAHFSVRNTMGAFEYARLCALVSRMGEAVSLCLYLGNEVNPKLRSCDDATSTAQNSEDSSSDVETCRFSARPSGSSQSNIGSHLEIQCFRSTIE
jgi:hypothetical protein